MTPTATARYQKMNGLGNEIVVVDLRGTKAHFTAAGAAAVAARTETSFDQMMVLHDPATRGTEAFIHIYNTDGSEAGACGNGMRCVGWQVADATGRRELLFETVAGVLPVTVASLDAITVDMGSPQFGWADIPLAEPFHDTRGIELQVGPIDAPLIHSPSVVNVGNPHCIFWVDRLDVIDLGKVGPMLEHHRLFPDRANITLARVDGPTAIEIKTWERGAGLTRACGSAACATAVAAARKKLTRRTVTVTVPGGPLQIEWTDRDRILMTGPAEREHEGTLDVW
jgi:diaminopimelate epimerase